MRLLILSILLAFLICPQASASTEDEKFSKLVDEYLELSWQLSPLNATFSGIHKYDDQLESLLLAESRKRMEQNKAFLQRFEQEIDSSKLDEGNRIDYQLILDGGKAQEFSLEKSRDLEKDPGIYPQVLAGTGFLMFSREYAPFPERMSNLAKRMKKMPQILEEGKKNLKNPPRLWTEIAIETTKGAVGFYRDLIGNSISEMPEGDDLRKRLETGNAAVIAALQAYQQFLEKDLLLKSTGAFADGRENFVYRLKNFYLMDQTPEEIKSSANKVLKETKAEMDRVAAKLDPKKKWWEILEEAKKKHWPEDQVLPEYRKATDRARQWVLDKKLASIPEEKLDVIETPLFMRFVTPYAAYFQPAPFEKEQKGFYFVTPVDASLPAEKKSGLLGEFYIDVENTTVHEAYPGHHLQFIHQNRLSKIRRLTGSSLMSEGWGLYCERLAEEFGFYSTPIDSLQAYRWVLVRAVRVLADVGMHVDGMSFEDAVNLMLEHTRLERGAAEGEVRRYTQTPTQPLSYLMGMLMIQDLRNEYQKKQKENFRIGEFHNAVLSYGSIPVSMIRTSMLAKLK
ncbi:DUF885 domain-containing protein [bacterium]|nr:DUF885 domain-containing protein [bacterium]